MKVSEFMDAARRAGSGESDGWLKAFAHRLADEGVLGDEPGVTLHLTDRQATALRALLYRTRAEGLGADAVELIDQLGGEDALDEDVRAGIEVALSIEGGE